MRNSLDTTEAVDIGHVVDSVTTVSVAAGHSGVGVAGLVPGAVDVAVAEGEVLVLVLWYSDKVLLSLIFY